MAKLITYSNFVKLEHTVFSLPLILAGSFAAGRAYPGAKLLLLILLAGFGARTAALGLNRIIDRNIDKLNPRTAARELPSGKMGLAESIAVVALGIAAYLAAAYMICPLVLYLSPIPLIVFTVYPYMKRFTHLCHFGVGAGLALAPLGGYVAVTCSLSGLLPAFLLALFTLFWVTGFDIIYATLDEEFDKSAGVHSMVARYGRHAALRISAALHALSFLALFAYYLLESRTLAAAPLLLAAGYLLYLEHKMASNVDLAFFKINAALGFVVFVFVLCGIYLP